MTQIFNQSFDKSKRRELRKNMSDSELTLWSCLQNRKIAGLRFRRQYGIGKYVVDFYCPKRRLAIEIDGEYHSNDNVKEYDQIRETYIQALGIKVMRFKNVEIQNCLPEVIASIENASTSSRGNASPSLRRRGDGGG